MKPDIDLMEACLIAEGVKSSSEYEMLEAWSYLIRTGYCWSMQGWYGRTAEDIIESGLINSAGEIQEYHPPLLS